jgi:hypothetical protein
MLVPRQTTIPSVVRIKPGALDRLGIYAERENFTRIALFFSQDLDERFVERLTASLDAAKVEILVQTPVDSLAFEKVVDLSHSCPGNADAIIGFGGRQGPGCGQIYRLSEAPALFLGSNFTLKRRFLQFAIQSYRQGPPTIIASGHSIRRRSRYRGVFACTGYPLALRSWRSGFEIYGSHRLEIGIPQDGDSSR